LLESCPPKKEHGSVRVSGSFLFCNVYSFCVQSRLLAKCCDLTTAGREDVSRSRLKVEMTKGLRPCTVFRVEARKAS
jgi:hypothetical protein